MREPSAGLLIATFVTLEVLAGIAWLVSAFGAVTALLLAIAGVQIALGAAVFMELAASHPVLRVVAVAIVFFIALLCAGIAGDSALR